MKRFVGMRVLVLSLVTTTVLAADRDPTRVLDRIPEDSRLGKAKDLNGYFPMKVPATKEAWEARKKELREQVLVANGLWPMPEPAPLKPVIHGKIERDDYTIEKAFFASYPGHYVCGNLYRPKGRTGKLPGVLCPHGHWANGRFFDYGEKAAAALVKQGAEKTFLGARYPLQARCAQLARMGCVVFHYDMVGVADSKQIEHTAGFIDAEAELRLQSFMGLQTYNSIRALDFLVGLPDVDPSRLGVTGASGGGTQTFILCAIDARPTVAFPAVMVSIAMQGGCICENCSYLRQNTGNIELAALFAPRPLGMTGANDWTRDIETKGLPELKALYKLYGAEDKVMAKCFLQFDHNYNQVSREVMYNWFNQHLKLELSEPVKERPFEPVPCQFPIHRHELSVFNQDHPLPPDALTAEGLRKYLIEMSSKQLAQLQPKDAESLKEYRRIVGSALRVMIGDKFPESGEVEAKDMGLVEQDGARVRKLVLSRKGQGEQIPTLWVIPPKNNGTIVVWIDAAGKSSLMKDGKWSAGARKILDMKASILAPDVFLTGEFSGAKAPTVEARYAGYTFGYNRPLLANRVHDILTAIAYTHGTTDRGTIHLVGFGKAGPWVVLARALCGDTVARTAVDMDQFSFDKVQTTSDEMMLPGALKYGGMQGFAALCAPGEFYGHNRRNAEPGPMAKAGYLAAGQPDNLQVRKDKAVAEVVVDWLLR